MHSAANRTASGHGSVSGTSSPVMNAAVERLNRAMSLLEQSFATGGGLGVTDPAVSSSKKKSAAAASLERERRACEDIRDVLTSWQLPALQRLDLNRSLGLLFLSLNHRESAIRLLADQALDAVFRKFQLKFQLQRVIAILLTELSKKSAARSFCAALHKLAHTVHLSRAQRAGVYGLHLMNSMCAALSRPEDAVHAAVAATFAPMFAHVGAHVAAGGAPHAEKAEELFRAAVTALALSGAAQRAACAVLAALSRHVPPILHKAFYRLADIILEADDSVDGRTRLAGALNAFRLMWPTVVDGLTDLSRPALRRILCRVLCLVRGASSNEVLVAGLELLSGAVFDVATPSALYDFNPLRVETGRVGSRAGSSAAASWAGRKRSSVDAPDGAAMIGDGMEILGIDDLENPLSDPKDDAWDTSLDLLDGAASTISEFAPVGRATPPAFRTFSRAGSTIADSEPDIPYEEEDDEGTVVIVDPLLNCDRYLNADEELAAAATVGTAEDGGVTPRAQSPTAFSSDGVPDELSADICVGHEDEMDFCVYASLCVAQRFLLSGLVVTRDSGGALRDDRAVRVSQKILALKCLSAAVVRQWRVSTAGVSRYDGQQSLTDAYAFIGHEDEGLALAAANFLLSNERASVFAGGQPLEAARILSLLRPLLRACGCDSGGGGRAAQLKGLLQTFTGAADLIIMDERMLAAAGQLALASMDCDYFLVKIARADFFAALDWRRASATARRRLQPRCRDALLSQLFDGDARVCRATCAALPALVRRADPPAEEASEIFYAGVPDFFAQSGLRPVPPILGLDADKFSLNGGNGTSAVVDSSLAAILRSVHQLAAENFHAHANGALAAWRTLADAFPPAIHPEAWLAGSSGPNTRNSFLCLLLELANGAAVLSLTDITALANILAAVLAGMAEQELSKSAPGRRTSARPTNSPAVGANFPVEQPVLEGVLIFYLRLLNIFHTIIAEEKTRNFNCAARGGAGASLLARAAAAAPAAELARKLVSPRRPPTAADAPARQRLHNFSYLVGTAVRPTRPTSYFQAPALRHVEPALAGAYRNFLESMNPERHAAFLEPLESALGGLCAVLETLDFELHVRTFLDELLLYLRTVFDVSPALSARCVHQCLKAIFGANARHFNFNGQRSPTITVMGRGADNGSLPASEPLETLLTRGQHEFTVFTAFAAHSDYLEAFTARDAGWLAHAGPSRAADHDRLAVADRLRHFDPFVTRLMQIYPLSNALDVRLTILDVLCTLVMNDVRYEMIDSEKKFYWRIVAQVRQPAAGEDVPLLGPLFGFLVALCRVGYVPLADVVGHLTAALSRVEEGGATAALDALHVVVLEARRLFAECGATTITDDAKGAALREARSFLVREFDFLLAQCPKSAAHLWILLLDSARRFAGNDWWTELSLEFLTRYANFVETAPRRRPPAAVDFVGVSVAFSCCEPSAFRPIDQLYDCMRTVFDQIKRPHNEPASPSYRPDGPDGSLVAAAAATRALPLLFVALCRLDEAVVLFRLGHYDNAANGAAAAERLGADVVGTLLALTRCLVGEDIAWLTDSPKPADVDEALVFLIQIIAYNVHAKRAPATVAAVRRRLSHCFARPTHDSSGSDGIRQVGRLVDSLALTFPRAHAHWLALLTALDIHSVDASRLYFRENYLSRTKSLIALLFFDKLSEVQKPEYRSGYRKIDGKLTEAGPNTVFECSNQTTTENIDEHRNPDQHDDYDNEATFFVGGFVAAASDEFCVRLLKWSAHPAMARRRPLAALPDEAAALFVARAERVLTVNRGAAAALRPTLDAFRRRHSGLLHNRADLRAADTFTPGDLLPEGIDGAHVDQTDDGPDGRSSEADLKFYLKMADRSANRSDFRNIFAFFAVSSTTDALKVVDRIPTINGLKFYEELFATIDRLGRAGAVKAHAHNDAVDVSAAARSALRKVALARLNAVAGQSPVETVSILAGLNGLSDVGDDKGHSDLWLEDDNTLIVDRIFNDLIAHLMITKLNHKAVRSVYFGALGAFFSRPAVRARFADDFYALDQIAPFLRILWTDTMPRWQRLSPPAGGWPIDAVPAADGGEWHEEIYGLFDIVQRVAHAFRAESLPIDAQLVSAFKALLRLPLLAKMAAVPSAALRLGWRLAVNHSSNGQIAIPLIHIHMLANHAHVLSDFVWRLGWLGWTERHQFEEFWMSLLGVLSSTPVAAGELSAAGAQAQPQLRISATAVEALTGLLLAAVGRGPAETTVAQRFFVKHRRRPESYLFLDTPVGRAASSANFWLLSSKNETVGQRLAANLESDGRPSGGWSDPTTNYGIGQTSLDYLWAITGLTAREPIDATAGDEPDSDRQPGPVGMPSSVSHFLLARSTAPDTTSSVRALFDNYLHWAAGGLAAMPIQLLPAVLKSMAVASDLIDDVHLYRIMFDRLRALFPAGGGGSSPLDEIDEAARGYATLLLLKCAAVVEWKDLLKGPTTPVGSTTVPSISDEAELARLVEAVALDGALSRRIPPHNFVGYCTLHGVLYLLQSLAVDRLAAGPFIGRLADFLMEELRRLRRPVDILTDCPSDTIEYHKLVWTVAFRLVEDALPIDPETKADFMKLISTLLVDPRLAGWEKRLLAGGAQALVTHSASHAPAFRLTALECLDTCQLRPSHLPYAVALYSTCFYRELNEGGEPAYELNKSFPADFQKLLNAFLFYATCPDRCDALAPVLAGLIGSAWAKERVIIGIWELISPIGRTALLQTDKEQCPSESASSGPNSFQSILVFSSFDRALLRLLYETVVHVGGANRRELCWSVLLPRLADVGCAKFSQFLAALLFGAAAERPWARCRAAFQLNGEQIALDADFVASARLLLDNFLEESENETPRSPSGASAGPRTRDALLELLSRARDDSPPSARRQRAAAGPPTAQPLAIDRRRVDIFQ